MGFVLDRKKRSKQVNVRLNSLDANNFNQIKTTMMHQTVSDSVRDLIRNGYLQLKNLRQGDVDAIMHNLPPEIEDEVKEFQLNVRLNDDEVKMTDELIMKMRCTSISTAIRNLIRIYHYSMTEG